MAAGKTQARSEEGDVLLMLGIEQLYTALNVAGIQATIDAYGAGYAIFADMVIPQDCTADKTINFYMESAPTETEVDIYSYSVNCRAKTMSEAMTIASTIISTTNRKNYSDCFLYIQPLPVIPPQDDTDNYNAPLSVTLKKTY